MFSLLCLFVALVDFEGRALVLIASFPGHCLPFADSELMISTGTNESSPMTRV